MNPTGTEARVCEMIASRQLKGLAKYGTTVASNPLEIAEWLQHLREELADALVYLTRMQEEMAKDKALTRQVHNWQETYGGACP